MTWVCKSFDFFVRLFRCPFRFAFITRRNTALGAVNPLVHLMAWYLQFLPYIQVCLNLRTLVTAIIAGLLGFSGIAGAAVGIAKILFFLFLVLFVGFLIFGRRAAPPV